MHRVLLITFAACLAVHAVCQTPIVAADRATADAAFGARDYRQAAELYAALPDGTGDVTVCYRLGYSLHRLGQLDAALPWHERAGNLHDQDARLAATATYNVACVHSLRGRKDEAFAALRLAAERGFRRAMQLRRDPDLESLRGDAEFERIVAAIEDKARLVAVVVHDGVETLDFAGPVEVFTSARSEQGDPVYRVRFVAPERRAVRPQHWRASIVPDFGIADCEQPAILVIPGGDTSVLEDDAAFMAWVQKVAPRCEVVLSVCTGAFVLAKAGLLDGKPATTYHGSRAGLQVQYPAVRVVDQKVVDSGLCVTAAGVSSGLDGALHVVQRQCGEASARRVAEYMEYAWQPAATAGSPGRPARESAAEPGYLAAVAKADRPVAEVLDAIEAALRLGACPTRTLTEPAFARLHSEPRFRGLIRDHARQSDTVIVQAGEPGTPLTVTGTVRDPAGRPVAGALVYVYQTNAQGTYSDGGMDEGNPRLFGYLRTDQDGRYGFRTIRPGHYPDQSEPVEQHIHFEVSAAGHATLHTRLGFADDPFWKGRTVPAWARPVARAADGSESCTCDVALR